MAIFNSVIFEDMNKSIGNATTCILKGQNVARKKATKVSNPRTLPQRKQRKVFPEMVEWSYALSAVLQVGLPSCPRKCTPENYFLTLNKQVAVADDDLSVAIDYSKLVISAGCRALPETANVIADAEARTLTFAFTEAEGYVAHSADDDLYYAVALETEKRRVKMEQLGARSGLESPMMNVPASWNMEALEVFVFVTSKDGKKASKTLYLAVE